MNENLIPRMPDGTFPKGVSGNPGGRRKSLSALIIEKTNDFKTQIDTMVNISNGKEVFGIKPKLSDIIESITWLADRGYGKPTQVVTENEEPAIMRLIINEVQES